MNRLTWMLLIFAWPSFWNACGQVSFEAGQGGSVYRSCTEVGADLSNCFNPQPANLKNMSQSINVAVQSQVDILFVIDNSGSMQQEQQGMGDKINGFLNKIGNLDWQIAVTTTDERATTPITGDTSRPWSDGQFRPFDSNAGSQYILRHAQVDPADAQSKLAAAIQMGVAGSGNERGINSVYRAVERAAAPSANRDFFRSNAKLAVVLISDEDECSTGLSGCSTNADKSKPENLLSLIQNQLGAAKGFTFNSIIKIPGDATCTTAASAGSTYKTLSDLTGGVTASVCASDYSTPLNVIGNRVVDLVNSATLNCAPLDMDGDQKPDVQVKLSGGGLYSGGYQVSGTNVSFSTPLPEGSHSFYYFCQ
jgi:hypothetical protein